MIKLLCKLPKHVTVAFSGGVDSVAVVDFLSRNHKVNCAFFHHRTENSNKAFSFVQKFCDERKLPLTVGFLTSTRPLDKSIEEYWRDERYTFLESVPGPVITAHHLDDCVETYLMSAMHGTPKVIPMSRNQHIIRPFLTTPKKQLIDWCIRKNISWCEDESNKDVAFMRNYVRMTLLPAALVVNPGLPTMVKKIVEKQKHTIYT